jgi:hypothetical protein
VFWTGEVDEVVVKKEVVDVWLLLVEKEVVDVWLLLVEKEVVDVWLVVVVVSTLVD